MAACARATGTDGPLRASRPPAGSVAAEVELVVGHQPVVQPPALAVDADVAGLRLGAAVVAAGHAHAQVAGCSRELRGDLLARGDAQAAGGRARAGHHVVAGPFGNPSPIASGRRRRPRPSPAGRRAAQILVLRRADFVEAVLRACSAASARSCAGVACAQRHRDRHARTPGLPLCERRAGGAGPRRRRVAAARATRRR